MASRARPYLHFIGARMAVTAMTLFGLMTLVFLMIKVIPGDEARIIAGPEAAPAQIEAVRVKFGLDAPLAVQYVRFLGQVLRGDLGTSISTLQPVLLDLRAVLPSTLELVVVTMVFSFLIATAAALVAASWRGSAVDDTSRVIAVIAGGLPTFWLALMIQYLFAAEWRIFPISGQQSFQFFADPITGSPLLDSLLRGNLSAFLDAVGYIVLPATALGIFFTVQLFRTLRASLIAILHSEFIVAARAKGVSFNRVMMRHALPNAMGPTITLAGIQLGIMVGSAVLVESIFGRQGIGSYLQNAVAQKDTFAVLGTVLAIGTLVCIINFVVDLVQLMLDPRVRAAQFEGSRR